MENRPNDDDFEVVEEIIDDFDYFYEDEEDFIRNKREKTKLKMLSILISVFVVFLIILFTGMIQMKVYNTKSYVSRELIRKTEYLELAMDAYEYARDFYTTKEVNNQNVDGIYIEMVKFINSGSFMMEDLEDMYLNQIIEKCNYYIGDISRNDDGKLENIKLPKSEKYRIFNDYLIDTYMSIYEICEFVKNNGAIDSLHIENYSKSKMILAQAYLDIQQG